MALALPTACVSRCVPPIARDDAELDLGLAELGVVRGDDHVGLHRELAAAAEREARHRRHHGLPRTRDRILVGAEVVEEGIDIRLVRHLLDVGAGGKRLLRAGDQDAADVGVGVERVDRRVELGDQRRVERVQRLRPVQADDADAAFGLDDDGFGAHGRCPTRMTAHG